MPLPKTIDISNSWEQACSLYILVLTAGHKKGRDNARVELLRMARIADRAVALLKEVEAGRVTAYSSTFIKKTLGGQ